MVDLPGRTDLQSAGGDFKTAVTKAMTDAAGQANVPIAFDEIAVAMKDDMLIANAVVAQTEPNTTGPPRVMFAYLSMAGRACASLLPTGFYTVEQHTDSLTGAPHAKFIRADGTTALDYVPINRHLTRRRTEAGYKYTGPLPFTAEVRIERAGVEQTQTVIVLHRVECHERAGWQWWEWVTITIDPDGPI